MTKDIILKVFTNTILLIPMSYLDSIYVSV